MRLIDADALLENAKKYVYPSDMTTTIALGIAETWIKDAPTVDAAPVRHGRWEFCGDDDLVCSVCGARYFKGWLLQSYYTGPGSDEMDGFWHCPHCGALLDGGENNATD